MGMLCISFVVLNEKHCHKNGQSYFFCKNFDLEISWTSEEKDMKIETKSELTLSKETFFSLRALSTIKVPTNFYPSSLPSEH